MGQCIKVLYALRQIWYYTLISLILSNLNIYICVCISTNIAITTSGNSSLEHFNSNIRAFREMQPSDIGFFSLSLKILPFFKSCLSGYEFSLYLIMRDGVGRFRCMHSVFITLYWPNAFTNIWKKCSDRSDNGGLVMTFKLSPWGECCKK